MPVHSSGGSEVLMEIDTCLCHCIVWVPTVWYYVFQQQKSTDFLSDKLSALAGIQIHINYSPEALAEAGSQKSFN